jgi:hypothetical protein
MGFEFSPLLKYMLQSLMKSFRLVIIPSLLTTLRHLRCSALLVATSPLVN